MAAASETDVNFDIFDFDSVATRQKYIDKGAFGEVYGPFDWNHKKFAFKRILIGQDASDTLEMKVTEKKSIWMALKHKNLVEIHHVSLKENAIYLVMEYAGGGSLSRFIHKSAVSFQVSNFARQIADGMLFLHAHDVVHRDLKPGNTMIMDSCNDHGQMILKITDFDEVKEHTHTTTMSVRGTCAYMAPEVLEKQWVSKASDVWSYGVLVWEMLTREIPHKDQQIGPLTAKAMHGKLTLDMRESIPEEYKKLLRDCLCHDRNGRPSFKKIIHELTNIDSSEHFGEPNQQEEGADAPDGPARERQIESESTQRLRSKYTHISNGLLGTGDIVAELFQRGVLTPRERDDIQQLLSTPIRANEQLLNTLLLKDGRAYDWFLKVLSKTGQKHIADILYREDTHLDTEQSLVIQRNYTDLLDNLNVDSGLLDRLYETGALTSREMETINAKRTKHEKRETLLNLVSRFSPDNFNRCLQALEESGQDNVASILRGKHYYSSASLSNDEIKHRIVNVYSTFVSDVDPDRLSDWLVQKYVMTIDQALRIRHENHAKPDRCRALLNHLFSIQHPRAFLVVWEALSDTEQYLLEQMGSKVILKEHEGHIRRYYDQLLSNLNVPDVATQMFKAGKLSARDHEHLRQFQSTPIKASEELLNIIIMNSRDLYECFLESLKKTKQHHVHQMLTSDEGSLCIGGPLVSEHSRLIRQNYDWLTEQLDPDSGLLSTLYAKQVLNQREYAQIVCEKDQFIKNEVLLSAMSRKSVEAFNQFIVALEGTFQEHIANRLTQKPIDVGEPSQQDEGTDAPDGPAGKRQIDSGDI